MLTIIEIINSPDFNLSLKLREHQNYLAHLKEDNKEPLSEHTTLTLQYLVRLIDENKIEPILNSAIINYVNNNFEGSKEAVSNCIKTIFVKTIFYHDFGKINPNFQKVKMDNPKFKEKDYGIGSEHSILSAYLFLSNGFEEIKESNFTDKEKNILLAVINIFAHTIIKHHGSLNKALVYPINKILCEQIKYFYNCFEGIDFLEIELFKTILNNHDSFSEIIDSLNNSFNLYFLVKLNSSLLTASDYLATNQFMLGIVVENFGLLNNSLKEKIIKSTYEISYNSELKNHFEEYQDHSFSELQTISKDNLNILRQNLSAEVISNYRNNSIQKLFYIEAPTGGGKTNLSLLVLNEILKNKKEINKIFYVFPFTSLITQTYDFIKTNLNLGEDEIIQLHSKAPFTENENEENYGSKRKNYIDALFINYPFILTSHISFFDVLTTNRKEANYLLHRLANSVVVLDELQSYSPSEWDKVNFLIQKYSEALNITFILMSATLPKISKLIINKSSIFIDRFTYLVENKNYYFNNPNFKNRANFRFDYVDTLKFNNKNLSKIVYQHSEEYFKKNGEVKAVIEFITKNSAQSFYEFIDSDSTFDNYEKLIITGTILEPRRREIIKYLKSDKIKDTKILIIATQVIEAGLDIDMDIGFKDVSIMDSEEQFAGRVNRNATKTGSEIFLFNSNNAQHVYKNDIRFKQQCFIEKNEFYEILQNKNFDAFYSLVFENIERYNDDIFAENLNSFLGLINKLDYREVSNRFQLIKSNTISIFVPLEISKEHFTKSEIQFLELLIKSNELSFNKICGRDIWDIYKNIITNKEIHFLDKKINMKILSSIMSKFTLSIWRNQKFYTLLQHYGTEEFGYFFLDNWENIYSYENGLKTDLETDCNFI